MLYKLIKKNEWIFLYFFNLFLYVFNVKRYFSIRNRIKQLSQFKNKTHQRECYIVLGGVSASRHDFSKLVDKDVITVNHFFRTEFWDLLKPIYHIVTDNNFFKNEKNILELISSNSHGCNILVNGRYCEKYDEIDGLNYIFPLYKYVGKLPTPDISITTTNFSTVTLQAIYSAIFFGYKEINLIGFDLPPGNMPHFYKEHEVEKAGVEIQKNKKDEFEYCGLYWQYTNCHHEAYGLERLAKTMGIEIFNMSDSSHVRSFKYKESLI